MATLDFTTKPFALTN
ncbi:unnamed protein product [Debaryomyces fabryi]|nr:unnamed protein product [Debaryomyces fabryi]